MSRATLGAVAVVSASILAYQVLLMRLLSIVSWHHFAYMIISVALLGFGASGTALAITQRYLLPRFHACFAASAALFAVTTIASFAVAVRLPFNPLAIVWDVRQLFWLTLSYALFVLPFFFGGGAIGLAFSRYRHEVGQLYAFDLVGAGIGALGVVGVLFLLSPTSTLCIIGALGLFAATLVLLPGVARRRSRLAATGLGVAAAVAALWLPSSLISLHQHVSEYKGLAMALRVPGARIIEERSSPLGLISIVESPTIPFRHAPGLSLNNTIEPPLQLGMFTDAEAISTITRFDGNLKRLSYLDFTTSALSYHLLEKPTVLILGAGGGEQVLLALYHAAQQISAVELNPQILHLVAGKYADFAGDIYGRPGVQLHVGEARSFIERTDDRYHLIQIPLLYSFGATAAGTHSLHESYTYTVEAIGNYLNHLRPGGFLSITLWEKLPPRDMLKLFATTVEALKEHEIADPGARLALIRSWKTATIIVKNGTFTTSETEKLKDFATSRSFDLDYYPGIRPEEANRYNILDRPYFFEAAAALLGPRGKEYIESYKFAIAPATDDRPYFYDFFKWRFLPELLNLRTQGVAAMLDMGYLVLFATLIQAALLSLLLILAPLAIRRRRFAGTAPKARTAAYFMAIGLAFLFIEIAYIQRFILFLGHPIYAVAVVLASFLVFAGGGSALAPRLDKLLCARHQARRLGALPVAVVGISGLTVLHFFGLTPLFAALIVLPDSVKIIVSLVLIAPLGFLMGMPFPLGIARVGRESPDLVPWAWSINGCASVIGAILATLLAIQFGFVVLVMIAITLYLTTPLTLRVNEPAQ